MADRSQKQKENVPGKYYVDTNCVPCNDCYREAPEFLKYSKDESHVYFARQPLTPDEILKANAAMLSCPTESIGDDGEDS